MEHGTAATARPGDTTGPGHGNLLVLLAACLTACFIALFTVLHCGFFVAVTLYARCGPRTLKAAAVYPLFVLVSGL